MNRTAVAFSMALLVAPAYAQSEASGQADRQGQQTSPSQAGERAASTSFKGRIKEVRTVSVGGVPHVLVGLDSDGQAQAPKRVTWVDLGPAAQLEQRQIGLYWGQPLDGTGVQARIGDQPIIAATSFSAGEQQQVQVRRESVAQAPAEPTEIVVQGRVSDTRQVQLEGAGDHHLIKVKHAGGESIVNLGPHTPAQLNLDTGDEVLISGVGARIAGKPVVLAQNIMEITRLPIEQSARQSSDKGAAGAAGSESRPRGMTPFRAVDKDGSGDIDRSELSEVPGVDMSWADKNNDGTLGREEYESAMKALGRPGPTRGGGYGAGAGGSSPAKEQQSR